MTQNTRRDFLKYSTVGAVSAAGATISPASALAAKSKGGPEGKVWKLPLDEENQRLFTAAEDHFMAHVASAAWVPLGVKLTLFEQPDGRGPAMVMGPGFHELAVVGFNDRASSARVRRAGN